LRQAKNHASNHGFVHKTAFSVPLPWAPGYLQHTSTAEAFALGVLFMMFYVVVVVVVFVVVKLH